MTTRWILLAALGIACGDKDADTGAADGADGASDGADGAGDGADGAGDGADGGGDGADGGDGGTGLQESCETGEDGVTTTTIGRRMTSSVTWTLTFNETAAETLGYEDCAYSRDFDGEELLGFDYLCADCDLIVRGDAVMPDGDADCYSQIASGDGSRPEWWGVTAAGALHRTGADQAPLGELTTFTGASGAGETLDIAWESTYDLGDGAEMTLAAAGVMAWESDDGLVLDDFYGPRADPYACGWECNDPGELGGDYDLQVGDILPNSRFEDACGDRVDLHDFYGSYLVIDTSQSDCGPCRSMAQTEEAFLAEMRTEGVPVRVVTLMGNGLADPYGTPPASTVDAWISSYSLTDPVLFDRGYAYALMPSFIEDFSGEGFGYPAWIVVDPEMRVIHGNVGFSSWDAVASVILDDASR